MQMDFFCYRTHKKQLLGGSRGRCKVLPKKLRHDCGYKTLPLEDTFAELEPQTIPDQDLVCDYAECSENSITDAVRLNCLHTFDKGLSKR